MRTRRPIVGDRPWVVTTLFVAATVHIVSVFALPRLAPRDAFQRLTVLGGPYAFHPLPRAKPGSELVPDRDPAMAAGVCRFDLADGPLRVRGRLTSDDLVALSFHARHGSVFYALTDKGTTDRTFDIVVLTPAQSQNLAPKEQDDNSPLELRLVAPEREGFVFARVLAPEPSAYADAEAQVAALTCAAEAAAKPPADKR